MRTSRRTGRLCAAVLAVLAPLQIIALAQDSAPTRSSAEATPALTRATPAQVPRERPLPALRPTATPALAPAPTPAPAPAAVPIVAAEPGSLVTEPEVVAAVAPPPAVRRRAVTFADRFPAQSAALQDPAQPASTRWALLIGINEHRGGVRDNIGSRQDAEDLRAHLLANGWRDENILLLTDRNATGANIRSGVAWLAEKTDEHSVAIFHYSGHSKKWRYDIDGDGEVPDEGLWPTDHDFIVDSDLVRMLDAVRPHALWANFASCNAAGFADPGLAQPGRVLTFSSGKPQKSYEHPAWGNSVWGFLFVEQAMMAGLGDFDHDGRVTVQEAFAWARPRASETTRTQRYGAQDAVIVDLLDGGFDVLIPGASRTSAPPTPASPAPENGGQERPPREGGDRNTLCLLCGR